MTHWLLLFVWLWPLFLALTHAPGFILPRRGRSARTRLDPVRAALSALGAVPALLVALALPTGTELDLPWLFLGTKLGLDETARVFLLFTAILWLAAGIYAARSIRGPNNAERFHALFLLAMAGNLWLIVGQDLFSFYAGFAVMGVACYGLIVHDSGPQALRAGRVYLGMTLLGEVCLFAALAIIADQTGTTVPTSADLAQIGPLAVALTIIGLGVKAGLVPLHIWLPGAYSAAPTPATAVLSGAMIKVALLGWLRFLPLGTVAMPELGIVLASWGLIALFYALPIGLVQADAKALLGYSSISKMGLAALVLGLMLIDPSLAPAGITALTLFAAHHALVKGGLFLGIGLRQDMPRRRWSSGAVLAGLALLALALASAPFTSGAVSKYAMKPILASSPWPWLSAAMVVSAVATTLLMGRLLWIVSMVRSPRPIGRLRGPAAAWGVIVALVGAFPFVLGEASSWSTNAAPVLIGLVLSAIVALAAWANPAWLRPLIGLVPPGDVLVLVQPSRDALVRSWQALARYGVGLLAPVRSRALALYARAFNATQGDREQWLRAWPMAGALWIGIIAILLAVTLVNVPAFTDEGTREDQPAKDAAGARRPPDARPHVLIRAERSRAIRG